MATCRSEKAKRHDSAFGRFYQPPDTDLQLPSVTHILSCLGKPALIQWAAKVERESVKEAAADLYADLRDCKPMDRMVYLSTLDNRLTKVKAHQRALAKAAEIGTQVHARVEWELRKMMGQITGPEPPLTPEGALAFTHFQNWAASVKLEPVFMEFTAWSLRHKYAGTLDLLARVNGELTVIDFKTSSAIYPEMFLQVAAYILAVHEMGQGSPDAGMIVRLPKNALDTFEAVAVPNWADRFEEFLKVRAMFDVWYRWESEYQARREAMKQAVNE